MSEILDELQVQYQSFLVAFEILIVVGTSEIEACVIYMQGMVKGLEKHAGESGADSEIADALAQQVI